MSEKHCCYDGRQKRCTHAYLDIFNRERCGARVKDYTTGECEQCSEHNTNGECELHNAVPTTWQRIKAMFRVRGKTD